MSIKREHGFTLIELLVVAVIVGILVTLVAMTYSGVQAKNRNSRRQANINVIQGKLETYYVENSKYPTLDQLNDAAWRKANLKDLSDGAIQDPQWSAKITACTNGSGATIFSMTPAAKCYTYQATTADGSPCSDKAPCTQYSLTTTLEGGEKYVKTSLN